MCIRDRGTIYPDVVESGLGGESAVIKSHHNVGGLPDFVDFKEIIEPLRNLFKDEVRKAGLELGIPENLVFRQPFPGPGPVSYTHRSSRGTIGTFAKTKAFPIGMTAQIIANIFQLSIPAA